MGNWTSKSRVKMRFVILVPVWYRFSLSITHLREVNTDSRCLRLLIQWAVPRSSFNILSKRGRCPSCGIIREIMLAPLLRGTNNKALQFCLVICILKYQCKHFCPRPLAKSGDIKTRLSLCPSVTKILTWIISSDVLMIKHWYLACVILVASPFHWHHAVT